MKCLIDGDILRYEIGHSGQYWDEDGEVIVRGWDFVEELLHDKLRNIELNCEATEPSRIYLTVDRQTVPIYNRWRKTHEHGGDPMELAPNYRDGIAKQKPYKGTRKNEKPAHYANITAHLLEHYDTTVANGVEADDLMAIDQNKDTIICSRDKDLRQVPGWHYSWECGKQNEIGPIQFDKRGYVRKTDEDKIFGGGEMFFIYQLLAGDPVDNIPGVPKIGPAKALKLLEDVKGRKEAYTVVREAYKAFYGEDELTYLNEQGRLLWLKRAENEGLWEYPYAVE